MILLLPFLVVPAMTAFSLAGTAFETKIALVLFGWFSPWPMPLTLVQAIGLNVALSLVIRHGKHGKDERSPGDICTDTFLHYVVAPLVFLLAGWMLTWWLPR